MTLSTWTGVDSFAALNAWAISQQTRDWTAARDQTMIRHGLCRRTVVQWQVC
jgi:hypothetical protein